MQSNVGTRLVSTLGKLGSALLDCWFPKTCAACTRPLGPGTAGSWCGECRRELPWLDSPLCPRCGRAFPEDPAAADHLCGECLGSHFHFNLARSATFHDGVVREGVNRLKFDGRLHWVPPLGELVHETLKTHFSTPPDIILPVPLHRRRLRQRGFNQAGLISRHLSRQARLPLRFDLLLRENWTEPQTRLSRARRLQNVRGAFRAPKPEQIAGRVVLLVDDVFTTGTTLNECARVLKNAGAAEVLALTVTRAARHRL